MKKILLAILLLCVSGCGKFDRWKVAMTGDAVETCHAGVIYLQFTSGATVKYKRDGSISLCD